MSLVSFTTSEINSLSNAISGTITASQTTPPIVSPLANNAVSQNSAENTILNSPTNIPINASGNATKAQTGIQKSNQDLAHACDSSSYVGIAIGQVGTFAAEIVYAIRQAVKAILTALGSNPATAAISSYIKKITQRINDAKKYINNIKNYLSQYETYVTQINQFLTFVLSLPATLLGYFTDCVSLLEKQLISTYTTELSSLTASASQINSITSTINSVKSSITTFINSIPSAPIIGVPTTQATTQFFASAGFSNTSGNYSKA